MKNNIDDSVNLCSPSLSVSESGNEELCSELSPVLDERSRRSLRCCVDGVSRPSITPYLPAAEVRPVFSCVEESGILQL